jgi:peptide/nickel transport system substrate-binding protein
MANVYDTLVRMSGDDPNKYEPELAESWEIINDTTWRFKLRKGVKFHNGEEFNAESVKVTMDAIKDAERNPKAGGFFASYTGVNIIDDYTVDITTDKPYAIFLTPMQTFFLLPPKYVQEKGWDEVAVKPVGTGAYKLVEWERDVHNKFEASDGYWKGKSAIGKFTIRPIPEDAARIAALQNGEVDLITSVPYDRLKELEEDESTRVTSRYGEMVALWYDTLRFEPFKNKKVRQAMNYAVNSEAIIKDLLLGYGTRLNSHLFPQQPGYDPDMKPYPYDPAKAKALLAEAGYPDGFDLEMTIDVANQAFAKGNEVTEVVVADLRKVGIRATAEFIEGAAWNDLFVNKKLTAWISTWKSNPESGRHLQTLLHSKTRGWYYQDPEADKILDEYFSELDPQKRIEVGKRMAKFFYDECPWVIMYQQRDVYGVSPKLAWDAKPDFLLRVRDMSLA